MAALEAQALQELLTEHARTAQGLEGVALRFFAHAANVISAPWTMAANQDFAFPQTQGERPANLAESGRYFAALNALAGEDVEVYRLVTDVFHLVKPMAVLQEEPLRSRVWAQLRKQPVE